MTTPCIHIRVRQIVARELRVDFPSTEPKATFARLGADSLDMIVLTHELEDEFGIDIEDELAAGISTVGEAIAAVEAKLGDMVQ